MYNDVKRVTYFYLMKYFKKLPIHSTREFLQQINPMESRNLKTVKN